MSTIAFDPSPGKRDGTLTVGNGHDQQLMPKANFAAVYNQTDFFIRQMLNDGSGYWLIPRSHSDSRGVQETAQPSCQAGQASLARDLLSDLAQMDRAALVQANQKLGEVAKTGIPHTWLQLSKTLIPSMIEFADWHRSSPITVCGNHNFPEERANQYPFC
jgi:hypothetical protein